MQHLTLYTIDIDLLCQKLAIYGVTDRSVRWFKSFLLDRKQRVQVGRGISGTASSSRGCPQGCLLSPLLFLIYIADMKLWMEKSTLCGYADDTSTSFGSSDEKEVINVLEKDAKNLLMFMASNSLAANPKKTCFLFFNRGKKCTPQSITVGDKIIYESPYHNVLGLVLSNDLTWQNHVYGKDGIMPSINRRVGALKRLSYHIPMKYLPKIAEATVASKIRYGIEIYGAIRSSSSDPQCSITKDLQVSLNHAMCIAMKSRIKDHVRIADLCDKTKIKSVNHMSAESKLKMVWSALENDESALNDIFTSDDCQPSASSRSKARGEFRLQANTTLSQKNVPNTAMKLWNAVGTTLKSCQKKSSAKREITKIVSTFPIV